MSNSKKPRKGGRLAICNGGEDDGTADGSSHAGVELEDEMEEGSEVDLPGKASRVKPPSYWLAVLTLSRAFKDINLSKQINFAEACVTRPGVSAVEATLKI